MRLGKEDEKVRISFTRSACHTVKEMTDMYFMGIFQLDEARKEGRRRKREAGQQPDVKSEEKAIEMSEDFDAKEQGPGRERFVSSSHSYMLWCLVV